MKLVNWEEALAGRPATVLFSALALPPHVDQVDANLVAVELPDDLFVDVEWVRKLGAYVVTLFRNDIENVIQEKRCHNASEVVEAVVHYVDLGCAMTSGAK